MACTVSAALTLPASGELSSRGRIAVSDARRLTALQRRPLKGLAIKGDAGRGQGRRGVGRCQASVEFESAAVEDDQGRKARAHRKLTVKQDGVPGARGEDGANGRDRSPSPSGEPRSNADADAGYKVLENGSGTIKFTDDGDVVLGAVVNARDDEDGDTPVISMRELRRRQKISEANRGKTPWNKGRQHDEDTKRKIRERTLAAMQRTDVRKRLAANHGTPHSEETRRNISEGVKAYWVQVKKDKEEKEAAEKAARIEALGYDPDAVLEEQEEKEEKEEKSGGGKAGEEIVVMGPRAEEKKKKEKAKRAPKSEEHKKKISEAIRAKWKDREYRKRVEGGMRKSGNCGGSRKRAKKAETSISTAAKGSSKPGAREVALRKELIARRRAEMRANAEILLRQAEEAASQLERSYRAGEVDGSHVEAARAAVAQARKILDQASAAGALAGEAPAAPAAKETALERRSRRLKEAEAEAEVETAHERRAAPPEMQSGNASSARAADDAGGEAAPAKAARVRSGRASRQDQASGEKVKKIWQNGRCIEVSLEDE